MNSVELIGRLVRDPEVRYAGESQMAVATFTLAIDRMSKGERKADFPRIKVFGRQAENCEKYLHKGSLAGIAGSIQTGNYQNKNGETVYTTDVVANRVEFLDPKASSEPQPAEPVQQSIDGFEALDEALPF